jgi:putative DNA methylase
VIPKECKRLAEVDFPIAMVSRHAAREKYAGKGYPNTLHMWWARRPYGACRAVLLALLLPDPGDNLCPEDFKNKARELLPNAVGPVGPKNEDLRAKLLKFIGDFANWDLAADPTSLLVARGLIKAAHPGEPPLVVDPFAGGGSIPLEALRLGCEAFASDLNPVAGLILKVMLEDIPRHGPDLADTFRRAGQVIDGAAENELAQFYPSDLDGGRPIVYLWARTVRCEAPDCGAEIPLMRSLWLSKVAGRRRALKLMILRPSNEAPRIELDILEPRSESEVPRGTVTLAKATCPCCGTVLTADRVRAQLADQRGGADTIFDDKGNRVGGARLLAVVTMKPGQQGRRYRLPTEQDYRPVRRAADALGRLVGAEALDSDSPVPHEPLPPIGTLGFRVQRYGVLEWGDLFTARQKLAMTTLVKLISAADSQTRELLSCALGRVAMSNMVCTRWNAVAEKMQHTFGRQALPMVWDFAEVVPTANAPGNWKSGYELIDALIGSWPHGSPIGQIHLADARNSPLVPESATVWFTDPPYYDAVPYADLSDFFFVWLKRALPNHPFLCDPFDSSNVLTPKIREIVQDNSKQINGKTKNRHFFEDAMVEVFEEGRRVLREDGIGSVVFAHKTTEGWEALLSGMIRGGVDYYRFLAHCYGDGHAP